ncbi:MAG: hypothetical protein ACI8UR_001181 [Natronomonas sp.]|jgi:hypothetical protein|uniref:hypothetical protein n=1 Tax=Natronomonas sp. TaxID=2184060 RepID=UPI0039E7211E
MNDDTLRYVPDLETDTVSRIVRTVLALAGLLLLVGLIAVLPGVDRLLAALTVSPVALVLAVATLLVVGALARIAPAAERLVEQVLDGPKGVVSNAAASAKLLVWFAAIVVAYRGFAPAVTPVFRAFGIGGLYHLGFLLAGLLALGAFARRLYHCWNPVTRFLTVYVMDATGQQTEPDTASRQ